MKISVLGAGAVGSMIGALLKHDSPETDVLLIVHGDHGNRVHERQTVVVDGPWGTHSVPVRASFDPADIAGSDFVLVTVKSQSTEEAARAAEPYWSSATVISIQNGINERLLAPHASPQQLVMGVTAINAALVEPGRVSLQLGGATILGPPADQPLSERVAAATEMLKRIKTPELTFDSLESLLGMRYNKLAVNALGYASCLSASNFITDALCCREWREAVGLPIIDECRRVFARAGIYPETISGIPFLRRIGRLTRMMSWPVIGTAIRAGARRRFDRKPIVFSLMQDLKRGKPTEVEYVNGEIVRLAETVGLRVPMNSEVVRMVHELEARGAGSYFTRDEVIKRFHGIGASPAAARAAAIPKPHPTSAQIPPTRSPSRPDLDRSTPR